MDKELLARILFWFFFALSIILIIWFIFGQSPAVESIGFAVFATFVVSIYHQVIDLHKRMANIEADVRVIKEEVVKGK